MSTNVLDIDLAKKLEASEIHTLESRLNGIQSINGNSMEAQIKAFGHATAFSVKNIPGPAYNTVKGLSAVDVKYIPAIIDYYKQSDISFRFEISPSHSSPELLRALSEHGYFQESFHTTLYTSLKDIGYEDCYNTNNEIIIRPLREEEFHIYAEIYTQAFQMPSFLINSVEKNNSILCNNKNWEFYLAEFDNETAGVAVLFIDNQIGNLAVAATLPQFRNNGIHTELIKYRIKRAISNNCDYIVGQAAFGSISQQNMQKVGLNIAYTKAIWVKR